MQSAHFEVGMFTYFVLGKKSPKVCICYLKMNVKTNLSLLCCLFMHCPCISSSEHCVNCLLAAVEHSHCRLANTSRKNFKITQAFGSYKLSNMNAIDVYVQVARSRSGKQYLVKFELDFGLEVPVGRDSYLMASLSICDAWKVIMELNR